MSQPVKKNNIQFNIVGNEKFWLAFEDNSWEPETFKVLDAVIKPDYVVTDIGAWIGPITLYLASKASYCYSFEPDPVAFKELSENIAANSHLTHKIKAYNKAVTPDGRPISLYSRFDYGDSGSSILKRVKSMNQTVLVESVIFEEFFNTNKIHPIHFIKMDIEGGEFFVLPQMLPFLKEHSPSLLLSLHFSALCEFLELKFFSRGWMRRIYRFIDRDKKFLKKKANQTIKKLIDSLRFYKIYDERLRPFPETTQFDQINMLFFSKEEIIAAIEAKK
ncbi:MAG: FkbM family methyltransferase [Bacteroidetes bacterium]|nr:FkbM family methyltransferase [Bacteroidota bacterium]